MRIALVGDEPDVYRDGEVFDVPPAVGSRADTAIEYRPFAGQQQRPLVGIEHDIDRIGAHDHGQWRSRASRP